VWIVVGYKVLKISAERRMIFGQHERERIVLVGERGPGAYNLSRSNQR
jgi:hypothetical protein